MDSKWLTPSIFHMMLCLSIISYINCESNNIFDVNGYGDIKVVNSDDLQNEWKKACGTSGGVLTVSGGTLSDSVLFQGPCNGKTTVTINGVLKAGSEVTLPAGNWIGFYVVNDLTINGNGTLDGNGAAAWTAPDKKRPTLLNFEQVTNAHIQDIRLVNSKMFHINFDGCQHVTIDNVNIQAPGDSPNTDGIHMGRSSDIKITNSVIAVGDDCVSMGPGTSNVNITGVFCGPGHGISIGSLGGSEGEQDVSSIFVSNCSVSNTLCGARIKTFAPSSALSVFDVTFQHLIMDNVYQPILIDQNYCPSGQCPQAESSVQVRDVKFTDVRGSSGMSVAVTLDCSPKKPCQDIELSGVNLNFKGQPTTAACSNADAKFIGPAQVPSKC